MSALAALPAVPALVSADPRGSCAPTSVAGVTRGDSCSCRSRWRMRSSPACRRTTASTPRFSRCWSARCGARRTSSPPARSRWCRSSPAPRSRQFAAPGTEQFVALAIALALMVGLMQLALGAFRLGAIVSFISHPVIIGFTNAAAIIIALSQLEQAARAWQARRSESFVSDVWDVLQQVGRHALPTPGDGSSGAGDHDCRAPVRRPPGRACWSPWWSPRPRAGRSASSATRPCDIAHIADDDARSVVESVLDKSRSVGLLRAEIAAKAASARTARAATGARPPPRPGAQLRHRDPAPRSKGRSSASDRLRARELRRFVFCRAPGADGAADALPPRGHWHPPARLPTGAAGASRAWTATAWCFPAAARSSARYRRGCRRSPCRTSRGRA